jgi:hypothetical protein
MFGSGVHSSMSKILRPRDQNTKFLVTERRRKEETGGVWFNNVRSPSSLKWVLTEGAFKGLWEMFSYCWNYYSISLKWYKNLVKGAVAHVRFGSVALRRENGYMPDTMAVRPEVGSDHFHFRTPYLWSCNLLFEAIPISTRSDTQGPRYHDTMIYVPLSGCAHRDMKRDTNP